MTQTHTPLEAKATHQHHLHFCTLTTIDSDPKQEMKQTVPFIVTTEKMKMSRV